MMKAVSIPSTAATTFIKGSACRLLSVLVTTAGTGSGNVIFTDGFGASDLAIDSVNPAKVTSASHSFVAADVGDALVIASGTGFTAATYTILSVVSGAAILSAPAGTVSSTSGVYTVGPNIVIGMIPATITIGTYYSFAPFGAPASTKLTVTNVSNGPVMTVVHDF